MMARIIVREIKERPVGPIREGKFGARALSLDDSPLGCIHTVSVHRIQDPTMRKFRDSVLYRK